MPRLDGHPVLVLASGAGRRMGGPKALMSVGGRAWWRVQAERLAGVGLDSTWVVSPEVLATFAHEPGAPASLVPGDPAAPMFTMVLLGLEALLPLARKGVFILPVDVPVPDGEVFEALTKKPPASIPVWQGRRGHPLWLSAEVAGELVRRARAGEISADRARLDLQIEALAVEVPVADDDVVINLNTPEDLRRWMVGGLSG